MTIRSCLLASAALALAAPALAEDLTWTSPSGIETQFYGQVNLTYQGVDDGVQDYSEFVDNSNSVTRLGIWIESPMGGSTFRFNFESALGILNTSETNQVENPDWLDWQRTDLRKFEVTLGGDWGAVWFGQGSMATDGAAEVDVSGTSVVGYVNLPDTAGAYQFRAGDALSGIKIGDTFKDFDGGRRFRFRYDTPDWSGVYVSAAYGDEVLVEDDDAHYYDAALRYSMENDQLTFDSAVGYAWKDDEDTTTEQFIASGSLYHKPTGLTATLAGGDDQSGSGQYLYGKLGWAGDLIAVGGTALSVDYYGGSDFVMDGSSSSSWGVQAVQDFDAWNLQAYLGYRDYAYDDSAADYQDISAVLAGFRWRF